MQHCSTPHCDNHCSNHQQHVLALAPAGLPKTRGLLVSAKSTTLHVASSSLNLSRSAWSTSTCTHHHFQPQVKSRTPNPTRPARMWRRLSRESLQLATRLRRASPKRARRDEGRGKKAIVRWAPATLLPIVTGPCFAGRQTGQTEV